MLPKVLSSEKKYQGRAFTVRVDEVEIKPGVVSRLDIVEHTGAVTLLPLDEAGHLWFIRQYRHSAREWILELPAGTLEPGEDPRVGAARELQEEIGMRAGKIAELVGFWLAPGYSTEYMHLYLATDLTPAPLEQDEDEVITVEKLSIPRALELAATGELRDSKSLIGLLTAARRFGW